MSKFVHTRDDGRLPKASELRRPTMPSDLLAELGVAEASRDAQRRAVARWLESNEPRVLLRVGLKRLDLLPQR